MKPFLLLFLLLINFSTMINGQTEESDESIPIVIPEQRMELVVRRILTWYFKPRNQKKIIYLAEKGLQKSWLPEIKGIQFQLLSMADVEGENGVYFFTKLKHKTKNRYEIGFAYGDPSCSFTGDSWYFHIDRKEVKLWHDGSSFGNGCSHDYGPSTS